MGRLEELKSDILKFAQPIAAALHIEIVECLVCVYNDTINVQVFADRPEGGIGIDECSEFNRQLDDKLFLDMNLGNTYTLEVSSPGLDRHLVSYADFRRVLGREVHVFLREQVNGRREMIGMLKAVREAEIILEAKRNDWVIPMDKIEKGKQVI
ncbi:MAG: hypothetical protein HQL19_05750 [Candidatus Omnitrophica bacterium]|nr:hypothetical protein [Candidatus Omnitrophota bacterium]